MNTVGNGLANQGDLHRKILLAAAAVIALMILFPPKYIVNQNPILGQSVSQSAGYHFVLSDPAGAEKATLDSTLGAGSSQLIGSGIEWGKLFLQLVIVAGATFALLRFLPNRQTRSAGDF